MTFAFTFVTVWKKYIQPCSHYYYSTQVGAHGSGATIPPIDEQITSMRIVTPALGTLELSEVPLTEFLGCIMFVFYLFILLQ